MRWTTHIKLLFQLIYFLSFSFAQQEPMLDDTSPTIVLAPPARILVTQTLTEGMDADVLTLTSTQYVDKNNNLVKPPTPADQGLETLKNAGIGIAIVIVVALIGIFILRKWKFTPTTRFRQKLATAEGLRQRTNETDTVFLRDLHAP